MAGETDQCDCPWSPGGASDLTGRTLAAEMEKTLGVRISITNTPGGAGAIGTQAMFDAPRDGYTWSANADGSIVTYQALDMLKQSHKDMRRSWRSSRRT